MLQRQPIYSQLQERASTPVAKHDGTAEWSVRRKLLAIVAASIVAWLVWAGAGFAVLRALAS